MLSSVTHSLIVNSFLLSPNFFDFTLVILKQKINKLVIFNYGKRIRIILRVSLSDNIGGFVIDLDTLPTEMMTS